MKCNQHLKKIFFLIFLIYLLNCVTLINGKMVVCSVKYNKYIENLVTHIFFL